MTDIGKKNNSQFKGEELFVTMLSRVCGRKIGQSMCEVVDDSVGNVCAKDGPSLWGSFGFGLAPVGTTHLL